METGTVSRLTGNDFFISYWPTAQLSALRSSLPRSRIIPARAPPRGDSLRHPAVIGVRRGYCLRRHQSHSPLRWRCSNGGNDTKGSRKGEEKDEEREDNASGGDKMNGVDGDKTQDVVDNDVDAKNRSGLWGRWLSTQRNSATNELLERTGNEDSQIAVDEATSKGPVAVDEGDGPEAERREGGEEETSPRREKIRKVKAVPGIWSRLPFWKYNEEGGDELDPEEKLILRDLENLSFNWKELFDPTVENLLALGLTILLAAGFLKIFMQLFGVIATILLTAAKYSLLATILLGLLIFVL